MDYNQAHAPHYAAAPSTYYTPSAPAAAVIGPGPYNPNPSSDQVQAQIPLSAPQGYDAGLTSTVGYDATQYQAATYASYPATGSAATGGVDLASAYYGSMPTVSPIHPVKKKKKKVNRIVTAQDLEAKKQKLLETGADANSVRTCTFCNVVCNSETVFASHIASEKHISRANGRPLAQQASYSANTFTQNPKPNKKKKKAPSAVRAPTVAQSVYCDVCKIMCNTLEMYNNHVSGKKHNKKVKNLTVRDGLIQFVPASSNLPETETQQTPTINNNVQQFIHCDVCKIGCNTPEMYNNHVSGKKHIRKVKNLTQTPATNDNNNEQQEHVNAASTETEPKPKRKSKGSSKEDLETKKRKLLESGAKGDLVKVCDLCNVVCNAPKVFEYHCKGQKHRDMVKKQGGGENLVGSAVACAAVATGVVSDQMAAAATG